MLTAIWLSGTGSKVSKRQWLGLVLGFAGLVLVVSRKFGAGGPGDQATWFNLSLAVMALFSITIGTLYQKRFVAACDVRTANAVQLLAALLVTLPLTLLEAEAMQWNGQLDGRHGLVGAGADAGRQFAAVHADPARRSGLGHQPDVPGAAVHRAVMAWLLFC